MTQEQDIKGASHATGMPPDEKAIDQLCDNLAQKLTKAHIDTLIEECRKIGKESSVTHSLWRITSEAHCFWDRMNALEMTCDKLQRTASYANVKEG